MDQTKCCYNYLSFETMYAICNFTEDDGFLEFLSSTFLLLHSFMTGGLIYKYSLDVVILTLCVCLSIVNSCLRVYTISPAEQCCWVSTRWWWVEQ